MTRNFDDFLALNDVFDDSYFDKEFVERTKAEMIADGMPPNEALIGALHAETKLFVTRYLRRYHEWASIPEQD